MKLQLTQAGYQTFTGQLGITTFTNGLSDMELSVEECAGIANIYQCDKIVTGTDVGKDDITDPSVVTSDTTGDFNVDTAPAPIDPTAPAIAA